MSSHPHYWPGVWQELSARGTADRRVSIREPMRGIFVWSWCARGERLWRSADAYAPYSWAPRASG